MCNLMPAHPPVSIAVLLHLSSTRNWPEFDAALQRLEQPFDLFINLVEGLNSSIELDRQSGLILGGYPHARIIRSSNRGMDVGGMFGLFELALEGAYQAVFYAHSKTDDNWRRKLLTTLTQNSTLILKAFTPEHQTSSRPVGMIGAYSYPFDYYNLGPYLQILQRLEIKTERSWSRYCRHYPAMRSTPIEQRIAHACESSSTKHRSRFRPELDLEYARAMLGDPALKQQAMNPQLLRRFVTDKVVSGLLYFPGNFFWISLPLIRRLRALIDFEHERALLPPDLSSDRNLQSRAHAWERALPVFATKNGYRLLTLKYG